MYKTILWGTLLLIGITTFILQIFIFSYPDGVVGFIMMATSLVLIISSTISLYRNNNTVKNIIKSILEVLFFWT